MTALPQGHRDLAYLLTTMAPVLDTEPYVFATVPPALAPRLLSAAWGMCQEVEGTSLILPLEVAAEAGLPLAPQWRRITLTVNSSLEAVGFLAAITEALAHSNISTNAVAGYYHDHLFVPVDRAEEALAILAHIAHPADLGRSQPSLGQSTTHDPE